MEIHDSVGEGCVCLYVNGTKFAQFGDLPTGACLIENGFKITAYKAIRNAKGISWRKTGNITPIICYRTGQLTEAYTEGSFMNDGTPGVGEAN